MESKIIKKRQYNKIVLNYETLEDNLKMLIQIGNNLFMYFCLLKIINEIEKKNLITPNMFS
jgi:hypothetical protein